LADQFRQRDYQAVEITAADGECKDRGRGVGTEVEAEVPSPEGGLQVHEEKRILAWRDVSMAPDLGQMWTLRLIHNSPRFSKSFPEPNTPATAAERAVCRPGRTSALVRYRRRHVLERNAHRTIRFGHRNGLHQRRSWPSRFSLAALGRFLPKLRSTLCRKRFINYVHLPNWLRVRGETSRRR